MQQHAELEIVVTEGEHRLDSRFLARQLGYEHETLLRSIKRHKVRLEAKSALRQIVGVLKHEHYRGSTRQVYYLLDERQCLILTGSLKKGEEAEEWHDKLVDAFLQARHRVRELEAQQPATTTTPQINSLWQERLERFHRETRLPAGYWCIFGMVAGYCYGDEFRGVHLQEDAVPDISVGLLWMKEVRRLELDEQRIQKYPHHYPDRRGVQLANVYPNEWLGAFWSWFHAHYLAHNYPLYLQTHAQAEPARQLQSAQPKSVRVANR